MTPLWTWRPLLFKIHLVGGLFAAAFLLILAVTGCIMAFESDIDRLLHPSLFRVNPSGPALPLTTLAANVAGALKPDERIAIYILPKKPENSCAFTIFASGRRPRQVFVDEYTGRILGSLSVVRFVVVAHAVHESSDMVMGCAAILLMSSVVSGLYLWWPLKRIKINLQGSKRRLYFDVHNSVGFFSSLFLLLFAVTGAYMAFSQWTIPVTYKLTRSKALPDDPASTPVSGATPISPDRAVLVARAYLVDAIPLWIVMPEEKTSSYLVKMRFPEDHSSNGASIVWVDQFSGKVLAAWNSRTAPLARKIERANRDIHSGDVWGYPSRVFACLVSMALVIQAITGPYLWWRRSRDTRMRRVETVATS
jgi:uncharacterized iron-regulated membrane protein